MHMQCVERRMVIFFSTLEKNGAAQTERGFPNKETNGEKEFYEIVFPCNIYST